MKMTVGPHLLLTCLSLGSTVLGLPAIAAAQPTRERALESEMEEPSAGIEVPIAASEAEVMGVGRAARTPEAQDLPLEEPVDPREYVCGSGDSFELRFWGKQNLSIQVTTDLEGNTFIPKVGKVRVAGKTLAQARTAILRAVRRYYPGIRSDLSLFKARQFMVHVVGDVKNPGLYKANARRRVSSLVAEAGGATGSIRRIRVRRRPKGTASADLLLYSRTGDARHNPYVLDGDVVQVPKAGIEVTIAGPVRDPGKYELVATRDLMELIELAGGLKSSASQALPIKILRRNRKERSMTIKVPLGTDQDRLSIPLRDDDIVVVPGTVELERSIALVGAVVGADPADPATTVKRLPFVEGDTIRSLIERAGGVTVAADLDNAYIRHEGEPLRQIDLEGLLVRRDFRKDRPVRIGDTIVVPFKRSSVLVEGAVIRPGPFQYNPRFGIREYLASAGGLSRYAQEQEDIRLIGADGKSRSFSEDLKVSPGDTIVVPERTFSRAEVVQLVMSGAGIVLSAAALTYAVTR